VILASFESVAETIRQQLREHDIPSMAIAVAQGGSILWEEGFGWANREERIPATPHVMYSLASISKPVTATALMMLVERGLIDLDRPINDYLGDAELTARVGDAAEATVRRVANHTSGLPLHFQFFYEDEPYRRPPMDETIRRYGNLVWAPGERSQYSNLGYGLLDSVISRVSGKPYEDFLREDVFLPLGMTRAAVGVPPYLAGFAAERYGSDGVPYPFYDFDHPGGSAVFCSAHDLVRFGMFHLGQTPPDARAILSAASLAEMQRPTASEEDGSGYGVGWGSKQRPDGPNTVSHSGGMGGVRTILLLVPSEGIAVAVLSNGGATGAYGGVGLTAIRALAVLAPEAGQTLERDYQESLSALTATSEPRPTAEIPPELLGEWRGQVHTYVRDLPLVLRFRESGDVHARLDTAPWSLVNDVTVKDGRLTGLFLGTLDTPDARRTRHTLHLDLTLRGDVLNGAVIALSVFAPEGGTPGHRVGNALAHWTELRRESDSRGEPCE
jgi:CubicO group peptidase (beta-lactamase class C family)